jgi:hypothetical protein
MTGSLRISKPPLIMISSSGGHGSVAVSAPRNVTVGLQRWPAVQMTTDRKLRANDRIAAESRRTGFSGLGPLPTQICH